MGTSYEASYINLQMRLCRTTSNKSVLPPICDKQLQPARVAGRMAAGGRRRWFTMHALCTTLDFAVHCIDYSFVDCFIKNAMQSLYNGCI